MLVARARRRAVLLDFFVEAPGAGPTRARAPLVPVDVSFGDAVQVFNVGAASCGAYGDAGRDLRRRPSASARCRSPSWRRPAAALARDGRRASTPSRPTCSRSSRRSPRYTPEARALLHARRPAAARGRGACATRSSPTRSSGSAPRAPAPFYTGDVAAAVVGLGRRARRHAHARGPRRLRRASRASPCASATAAARCSPTRRRAPAACCSPTRSRCSTARPGRRRRSALVAAMERAQDERTPAFLEGLAEPGFLDALHGQPARLDDAHLGARRRRLGLLGHVHQRRGLGRRRARHRHAPQQHDGRAGPLAARLLHPPAGPPAAVDDGADGRAARRRARARARLGGLQPDPLGAPPGDRQRDRPRAGRARRRSTRRACTARTASSTPSRGSTRRRWRRPAARSPASASATCSSAAARRSSGGRTGRCRAGGDPRRGGLRWRPEPAASTQRRVPAARRLDSHRW